VPSPFVVLIAAAAEWRAVLRHYAKTPVAGSPLGPWFEATVGEGPRAHRVVLFHTGFGKIRAASSTQYVVDRWHPSLLVNLGTCGGFAGEVERGDVVLVNRTLVYDVLDRTGAAIATDDCDVALDLSWLQERYPAAVRVGPMLSADRDLDPGDISRLRAAYGGIAADWESAAIAYVAAANRTPALILRGVSDLVSADGGEAYGNTAVFEAGVERVMEALLRQLPLWLSRWTGASTSGHV
jgi:adenosylhomocysteine nucleosidase